MGHELALVVGAAAGYAGRWLDDVVSRVIDILMAFPGILLALALVAVLGPSLTNVVLALASIGWVGYARLVRGQHDLGELQRALTLPGARLADILKNYVGSAPRDALTKPSISTLAESDRS